MDVERRLRETLDARATEALGPVPDGMPPDVRRRARHRQARLALLGGIVAGALLFAALTASRVLTVERPTDPAGAPPRQPQDSGPSQQVPHASDRTVLGRGISDGLRWELFVYRQGSLWCLGIAAGKEERSGCPVRGDHLTSMEAPGPGDPKLVYGTVSAAVARLDASPVDGRHRRVRMLDVPPGLDPPFERAFVVAAEAKSTVIVTAYDERGREISSAGA